MELGELPKTADKKKIGMNKWSISPWFDLDVQLGAPLYLLLLFLFFFFSLNPDVDFCACGYYCKSFERLDVQ